MTAVGPPDCATSKFPTNSAIFQFSSLRGNRANARKIEPEPCLAAKRMSKGKTVNKPARKWRCRLTLPTARTYCEPMPSLVIQLPARPDQTEFNLRRWEELLDDPDLARI